MIYDGFLLDFAVLVRVLFSRSLMIFFFYAPNWRLEDDGTKSSEQTMSTP